MPLAPARPLLLLLLALCMHVLIPTATMTNLALINPWLSPCDLAALEQLQHETPGGCAAAVLPSPSSSSSSTTTSPLCTNPDGSPSRKPCQCLFYYDRHKDTEPLCGVGKDKWAISFLRQLKFAYCREFLVYDSLPDTLISKIVRGNRDCRDVADAIVAVDELAQRVACYYEHVLNRFDCETPFSTKFNCSNCKDAYRKWACSTLLPHYTNFGNASAERKRIRPCRSICQTVEQQCPYFLPADHAPGYPTQYAGEPTFLCMDSYIPEVGEQLLHSLYAADKACCVTFSETSACEMTIRGGSRGNRTLCASADLLSYDEAVRARQIAPPCEQVDFTSSGLSGTTSTSTSTISSTRGTCLARPMYSSPHNMPPKRSSAAAYSPIATLVFLLPLLLLLPRRRPLPLILLPITTAYGVLLLRMRLLVELLLRLLIAPRARPLCLHTTKPITLNHQRQYYTAPIRPLAVINYYFANPPNLAPSSQVSVFTTHSLRYQFVVYNPIINEATLIKLMTSIRRQPRRVFKTQKTTTKRLNCCCCCFCCAVARTQHTYKTQLEIIVRFCVIARLRGASQCFNNR